MRRGADHGPGGRRPSDRRGAWLGIALVAVSTAVAGIATGNAATGIGIGLGFALVAAWVLLRG